MKRSPIRLTENDIVNIASRIIKEQQTATNQQPAGDCVRTGMFVKNCQNLYRKADAGLVVVSPEGGISISQGNGQYIQLNSNEVAYGTIDVNNRENATNQINLAAQGNKPDSNTMVFLVQVVNPQTLLSILNDGDCQRNKTVTFLKTVIKNFGTTQQFIQAAQVNPSVKNSENIQDVATKLIQPIIGR